MSTPVPPPRPARAVILDRDGVVNVDTGYLWRIEECVFVEGIEALLRDFARRGFLRVVATNQSGIGRGLFGEADFERLMRHIGDRLAAAGAGLDAVYHCPDHPTEGIGRYRRDSPWRKPAPGMFLQAASDLGLDLAASWAIGDSPRDMAAAAAAGVGHRVLLEPGGAVRFADGIWRVPSLGAIHALLADQEGDSASGS